jgi:aspartyl protease family protein
MRQIMFLAAAVLVAGGYAARYADRTVGQVQPLAVDVQPARQAAVQPRQPTTSRSLTVEGDRRGHFRVEARVDGRYLDFIVDTGASLVVLRESDAARVGIRPMPRDYTASVSTANGKIKAARATLDRIELGGITVYDVAALVLPDEALTQNLLGVSFLSRLRRYEVADGRLVLEQ